MARDIHKIVQRGHTFKGLILVAGESNIGDLRRKGGGSTSVLFLPWRLSPDVDFFVLAALRSCGGGGVLWVSF